MNTISIISLICAVFVLTSAQQWTPQQLAAYRQQYYNWWYNQQRMQQAAQFQPATQAPTPAPAAQNPFQMFGNAQSDSKGNFWHGSDDAKLLLVARSSWP